MNILKNLKNVNVHFKKDTGRKWKNRKHNLQHLLEETF